MFQKNLDAINQKNPILAEELKKYPLNMIDIFESQTGDVNINYKNIDIHNDINPIEEAQILFNQFSTSDSKNTFYILFGIGLGYLLKRLHMSSSGRIIIYEPFMDILRFTLEYVDFANELSDPRVSICSSPKEVLDELSGKYLKGDNIEVCYLPSYIKFASKQLENMTSSVVGFIKSQNQDQNTIIQRALHWGRVSTVNLRYIKKSLNVDHLENLFNDKTIVIASAGPTLEENLPLIKKHRDKFVLLTVNTALKALLKNDIIPDFCAISEVAYIDFQFKGLENLDKINYILHPRAQIIYPWNLNPKANFVYLAETDGFSVWYNKLLNNKYNLWPTAGTVALMAFYVATHIFNAQKIILVGQDLALVDNQVYSSSCVNENEKFVVDGSNISLDSPIKERSVLMSKFNLIKVKNSLGEEILTKNDYYQYISYYEDIIKNELSNEIEVINTSLKGAYIKGMKYLRFEESIKSSEDLNISVSSIIDKIIEKNSKEVLDNIERCNPEIEKLIRSIEVAIPQIKKSLSTIRNFEMLYKKKPKDIKLFAMLENIYKQKSLTSELLNKNELLFFMMQKPNLEYINNFIMPKQGQQLTLQQHASNIKQEQKLLQEALIVLEWFLIKKEHIFEIVN